MARTRPPPGFSMIELMLVVAILAVASMIIVPNLANLSPKYRLRAGARELAATVAQVRTDAILAGQAQAMVYDLDRQLYGARGLNEQGQPVAEGQEELLELPSEIRIAKIILPDEKTFSSGRKALDIDPALAQGSHIIVLESETQETHYIKFNVLAGTLTHSRLGELKFHKME